MRIVYIYLQKQIGYIALRVFIQYRGVFNINFRQYNNIRYPSDKRQRCSNLQTFRSLSPIQVSEWEIWSEIRFFIPVPRIRNIKHSLVKYNTIRGKILTGTRWGSLQGILFLKKIRFISTTMNQVDYELAYGYLRRSCRKHCRVHRSLEDKRLVSAYSLTNL